MDLTIVSDLILESQEGGNILYTQKTAWVYSPTTSDMPPDNSFRDDYDILSSFCSKYTETKYTIFNIKQNVKFIQM